MKNINIPILIIWAITCVAEIIIFCTGKDMFALVFAIIFGVLTVGEILISIYFNHGKENEVPLPATVAWVSKGLRKYLEQDKFGVYKKPNVKIPWYYKLEYNSNKKHREFMINYYYENLENITDLDRMEKENLLRKG